MGCKWSLTVLLVSFCFYQQCCYDGKNLFSSSMKIKEDYIITFITDCLPLEVMISVQLKMF